MDVIAGSLVKSVTFREDSPQGLSASPSSPLNDECMSEFLAEKLELNLQKMGYAPALVKKIVGEVSRTMGARSIEMHKSFPSKNLSIEIRGVNGEVIVHLHYPSQDYYNGLYSS